MMKQIFAILAVGALCLCSAKAAIVSSNLLTLTSVSASTNAGAAVSLGTVYLPATTYSIQSVGTGGTNTSSGGRIYIGVTTNKAEMTLAGTYTITNDTVASYTLTNQTVRIYTIFEAYNTTNVAVSIGAQAIQSR